LGEAKLGVNPTFMLAIKNTGNKPLLLTGDTKVKVTGPHADQFFIYNPGLSWGSSDLSFNPGSVSSQIEENFMVQFKPKGANGDRSATLTIESNDPDEGTFVIHLKGKKIASNAQINIREKETEVSLVNNASPSAQTDFGTVNIGYEKWLRYTIANGQGLDPLAFTGEPKVVLSGPHKEQFEAFLSEESAYGYGAQSFTLLHTLYLAVKFKPSGENGERTATLTIPTNDPANGNFVIKLRGNVLASLPEIEVSPYGGEVIANNGQFDLGASYSGESLSKSFTIANSGPGTLNLTGTPKVQLSGADASQFSIDYQPYNSSLSPQGGSDQFGILFTPSGMPGERNATLTILNNDSDEGTYTIHLKGSALESRPEIDLKTQSGNSIANGGTTDFGEAKAFEQTKELTFTIVNTGAGTLSFTGEKIAISGTHASQFEVLSSFNGNSLGPEGSTTFTIRFKPVGNPGQRTAILTISNNDADESEYVLNLTAKCLAGVGPNTGEALHFGTSNNYFSLDDFGSLDMNNMSIEFYIKPDQNGKGTILSGDSNDGSFAVSIDGSGNLNIKTITWVWNQPRQEKTFTVGKLEWDKWQHVAISHNASTYNCYINGVLKKTEAFGAIPDGGSFKIGNSGTGDSFKGALDELRIWRKVLSSTEINTRKSCELKGSEDGLAAYYPFNQGVGGADNTGDYEESSYTNWLGKTTIYKNYYAFDGKSGSTSKSMMIGFSFTGLSSNWVKGSPVKSGVKCP
jgi:hypothetical protein